MWRRVGFDLPVSDERVRVDSRVGIEEALFLGTRVHAVTPQSLLEVIERAVDSRRRLVVGHHNLHSLALLQHDCAFAAYFARCDLVYADGMAVVMLARLLGHGLTRENRLTSLDFVDLILARAAERRWRVFYLGSAPSVIDAGIREMRSRHPFLRIEYRHGHFDMDPSSADAQEVLANANAFDPDVLIVGMGMPRQERWILDNLEALRARVVFPIGALADYLAGAIPTPPRWAGRVGLEWLFRLLSEPKRLGHRYLVEPWTLVRPLAQEFIRRHRDS